MVVEGVAPAPWAELRQWRHRWAHLISFCRDPFVEVDHRGVVTEWNPRAEEVFGWRREEVVGRSIADTVMPSGRAESPFDGAASDRGEIADEQGRRSVVGSDRCQLELVHRAGHRMVADALLFDIGSGNGRSRGGFIRHPSDRSRADAGYDSLTGLPDRIRFGRQLAEAAARGRGNPGAVAVALFDLDRFKAINNSMGQEAGDMVLASVAERLRSSASPGDYIGRFGGDEFLALFESQSGTAHSDASAFIERARNALTAPIEIDGREVFLDASVGIAVNAFAVDDPATLLSNAEAAMYQAKRRGGSSVRDLR